MRPSFLSLVLLLLTVRTDFAGAQIWQEVTIPMSDGVHVDLVRRHALLY